jgi:hypothetical protein
VTVPKLGKGLKWAQEDAMRISVKLPPIDPDVYQEAEACPYCGGQHFKAHGRKGNTKALRDFNYAEVSSKRVECMRCRQTFRIYPVGVSRAQQSDRLKAISVLL